MVDFWFVDYFMYPFILAYLTQANFLIGSLDLGYQPLLKTGSCKKQTTFLKDMFRHAYAIISLISS